MRCPKCGTLLENTYRCPNCQHIEKTMKRIIHASNFHYNVGLSKAKIRDLSGACTSLQLSLKYNKRNTHARNLLGLVYFQMGETVEALGQWIISVHFQEKNNIARSYIKKVQENQKQLQQINHTIQKYNLALGYVSEHKDKQAIDELKKVVHLNPNYIRAYQLLGLLYIKQKNYASARKILMKAIKLDRNNLVTVGYMNEIASKSGIKHKDAQREKRKIPAFQLKDPKPIIIEKSANQYTDFNTSTLSFVNIIIGIIIGAAVVGLLLIPSIYKTKAAEYNEAIVEYSGQISERNKQIATLQSKIDTLTDENDQLTNDMDSAGSMADNNLNENMLIEAMKMFLDNDFVSAATKLSEVDRNMLENLEAQNVYDYLIAQTSDSVLDSMYADAYQYYLDKDYMKAVNLFKKVINLNPESVQALYYCGESYEKLTDFEQARSCYSKIVSDFSDSNFADDAQDGLNRLSNRLSN